MPLLKVAPVFPDTWVVPIWGIEVIHFLRPSSPIQVEHTHGPAPSPAPTAGTVQAPRTWMKRSPRRGRIAAPDQFRLLPNRPPCRMPVPPAPGSPSDSSADRMRN